MLSCPSSTACRRRCWCRRSSATWALPDRLHVPAHSRVYRRTAPYAFTERGVAMMSSVLGSKRAIAVNIENMRTFVRVRALTATHGDLAKRLAGLEDKTEAIAMQRDTFSRNTRNQLKQVFDALRELVTPTDPPPAADWVRHDGGQGQQREGRRQKLKPDIAEEARPLLRLLR